MVTRFCRRRDLVTYATKRRARPFARISPVKRFHRVFFFRSPLPPPTEGIINRSSKREISRRKQVARTRDPLLSRTADSSFNEPIDRSIRIFNGDTFSIPLVFLSLSLYPEKKGYSIWRQKMIQDSWTENFVSSFKLNEFSSVFSIEQKNNQLYVVSIVTRKTNCA